MMGTMELSRRFKGKKFMWDGQPYATAEQDREMAQKYREAGFQVELVVEGNVSYVFTRREVKEVVV